MSTSFLLLLLLGHQDDVYQRDYTSVFTMTNFPLSDSRLSPQRLMTKHNVFTMMSQQRDVLCFIVHKKLHDRKTCKLTKGNADPQCTILAHSRSAVITLLHTQGFDRNVLNIAGSSRPIVNSIVNEDDNYFITLLGSPATEWISSY